MIRGSIYKTGAAVQGEGETRDPIERARRIDPKAADAENSVDQQLNDAFAHFQKGTPAQEPVTGTTKDQQVTTPSAESKPATTPDAGAQDTARPTSATDGQGTGDGESTTPSFEDLQTRNTELEAELQGRDELIDQATRSIEWGRNLALTKSNEAANLKQALGKAVDGELTQEELDSCLAGETPPTGGQQVQRFDPYTGEEIAGTQKDPAVGDADAAVFALKHRLFGPRLKRFGEFMQSGQLPVEAVVEGDRYGTLTNGLKVFDAKEGKRIDVATQAAKATQAAQVNVVKGATTTGSTGSPTGTTVPRDYRDMSVEEIEESGAAEEAWKIVARANA